MVRAIVKTVAATEIVVETEIVAGTETVVVIVTAPEVVDRRETQRSPGWRKLRYKCCKVRMNLGDKCSKTKWNSGESSDK